MRNFGMYQLGQHLGRVEQRTSIGVFFSVCLSISELKAPAHYLYKAMTLNKVDRDTQTNGS